MGRKRSGGRSRRVGNHVLWLSVGVVSEITHATACYFRGHLSLNFQSDLKLGLKFQVQRLI